MLSARRAVGRARHDDAGTVAVLLAWVKYALAWVDLRRPMRVWKVYKMRHGPLMAAGAAYNMFFAVAAMLVAGFSVLGIVAAGNEQLQRFVVNAVDSSTPGLIDTGQGGLATPDQLFSTGGAFSITLIISLATMVLTSLGWIAGLREGMRGVNGVPPVMGNPVLKILKDAGTLIILGIALVVTTAVGVAVNTVLDTLLHLVHLDGPATKVLLQVAGTVVMLLLDMVVAVILFRIASSLTMPKRIMFQASLLAGIGSTLLRIFSSQLLGNVGSNPLLAPFAVILGLFVWFYLLSQVYLIATAWGTVGSVDYAVAQRQARERGRGGSLRQRSRAAARREAAEKRRAAAET